MTSGRITSITTDVRGDTLAAAVLATDTVLTLTDVVDFDEDDTSERWLVIADSDPLQYLAVDDDANTVTLAAPVGTAYEAGMPVVAWDPTVPDGGAAVVEHVATVMTDRGSVDAIVPHEKVPLTGFDNLTGASVTLEEDDDGDWTVAQVLGREPLLDNAAIHLGVYSGRYRSSDISIPDTTYTSLPFGSLSSVPDRRIAYSGNAWTVETPGVYLLVVRVAFASNTVGARRVSALVNGTQVAVANRSDSEAMPILQLVVMEFLDVGDVLSVEVQQSSGSALNVLGGVRLTNARITMMGNQ